MEYNQPGVNVLDRDNVGIILRLAPQKNKEAHLIVSTTHILYNKKRHDVKLAQVHLLLAEIERVAYKGYKKYYKSVHNLFVNCVILCLILNNEFL